MFIDFFYQLRGADIPVSPTAFLTLQRALAAGLVDGVDAFYTASRAILVKSERHFDRFDRLFAHHFQGAELSVDDDWQLDEVARLMLDQWLADPKTLADALGMDEDELAQYTPEELLDYFKARLQDQDGRHDGGSRWIGTGGTSPVGHGGHHPGGMRVGGISRNRSAVQLALERRYKDYDSSGPLTQGQVGEALRRLRHLKPEGPADQVAIDDTIRRTVRNGGEIEIVFEPRLRDRLRVVLAIDNGGWSMDSYIPVVQTLFDYARAQFRELDTFFFHNTIYDTLWADPARIRQPSTVTELLRRDRDTRWVIVGDASMAPYELMAADGSIYAGERSGRASLERLKEIATRFPHCAWLNPVPPRMWPYTPTIRLISGIVPMFELSIDGLSKAVDHLAAG